MKEFAEVFTAEREVKAMLDLLPCSVSKNIDATYLEPACGTGNFLIEILERKLMLIAESSSAEEKAFCVLRALASIYAADIQLDNVKESRARLLRRALQSVPEEFRTLDFTSSAIRVQEHNIRCLDFLSIDASKEFSPWRINGVSLINEKSCSVVSPHGITCPP